MDIQTTRFGVISVEDERIMTFSGGLLGFPSGPDKDFLILSTGVAGQVDTLGNTGGGSPGSTLSARALQTRTKGSPSTWATLAPAGETWSGYPAKPLRQFLREAIWLAKQASGKARS